MRPDKIDLFDAADFLYGYICHRKDDYGLQLRNGSYSRQGGQLTYTQVLEHLEGDKTVGVYQTAYPAETCRWIAYDIDDHSGKGFSKIQRTLLETALKANKVPFYVEGSGSKDSYHFWVFFKHPVSLALAYNYARAMVVQKGRYMFSGEIFPKQEKLSPDKVYGNLIKLPLGLNRKSNSWSYFEGPFDDIETVDLTDWEPVELPGRKVAGKNTAIISENYVRSREIKPCVRKILDTGLQMKGECGHRLRIAVASELHRMGLTTSEIVELFKPQSDFEYGKCWDKVESVRTYYRPRCDTIQGHCKTLKAETGQDFEIMKICESCPLHLSIAH